MFRVHPLRSSVSWPPDPDGDKDRVDGEIVHVAVGGRVEPVGGVARPRGRLGAVKQLRRGDVVDHRRLRGLRIAAGQPIDEALRAGVAGMEVGHDRILRRVLEIEGVAGIGDRVRFRSRIGAVVAEIIIAGCRGDVWPDLVTSVSGRSRHNRVAIAAVSDEKRCPEL